MSWLGYLSDELQVPQQVQSTPDAPIGEVPPIQGPFSGVTKTTSSFNINYSKRQRFMVNRAMMFANDDILEKIIITPLTDFTWDNDAEQQQTQKDNYFKDTVSDENVERIQLAQGILEGWDNDIERQIPFPEWNKDHLSDEGVELIHYSTGVIDGWDTDAQQQLPQPAWYIDYWEQNDEYSVIPTVVPPMVLVVYQILCAATTLGFINATPNTLDYSITAAVNTEIGSITSQVTTQIYSVTCELTTSVTAIYNIASGL